MTAPALYTALTYDESQRCIELDPALVDAIQRVGELDFTLLRHKLMQENGWTLEMCDETEDLYRKFLALNLRYPDRKICPTGPIDDFWHAHILDTTAYATDCQRLFGRLLNHYPYFGLRGPQDKRDLEQAFAESVELFILSFGVDPTAGDCGARSCRPQRCP